METKFYILDIQYTMSQAVKQVLTKSKTKTRVKAPDLYNVILLNDDFTPQDFVVKVIMQVFHKNMVESYNIMIEAHNSIFNYNFFIDNTLRNKNYVIINK